MDDALKEGIRVAAGAVGAFVGGILMRLGWRKAKEGRTVLSISPDAQRAKVGRTITSKEWHDLRDEIHRIVWEQDRLRRDLDYLRARFDATR